MKYSKIENGKIVVDSQYLPVNYLDTNGVWITGFNNMDQKKLKGYGFVPVRPIEVEYDSDTQDIRYLHHELSEDGTHTIPTYVLTDKVVEPEIIEDSVPVGVSNETFDIQRMAFITNKLKMSKKL